MHTDPRWPAEFRLGEAAVALRERTEEQLAQVGPRTEEQLAVSRKQEVVVSTAGAQHVGGRHMHMRVCTCAGARACAHARAHTGGHVQPGGRHDRAIRTVRRVVPAAPPRAAAVLHGMADDRPRERQAAGAPIALPERSHERSAAAQERGMHSQFLHTV
eukprot:scaffold103626_cov33-Phaeocystis_antarctica.AAC.1